MASFRLGRALITAYVVLFVVYMLAPLAVMGGFFFNDSGFT